METIGKTPNPQNNHHCFTANNKKETEKIQSTKLSFYKKIKKTQHVLAAECQNMLQRFLDHDKQKTWHTQCCSTARVYLELSAHFYLRTFQLPVLVQIAGSPVTSPDPVKLGQAWWNYGHQLFWSA